MHVGRFHAEIRADQKLRERGEGETSLTNPNIRVRRRYKKIYEDFRPGEPSTHSWLCAWLGACQRWGNVLWWASALYVRFLANDRVCSHLCVAVSDDVGACGLLAGMSFWKLVLISRKLFLAVTAILLSSKPELQAGLSVRRPSMLV